VEQAIAGLPGAAAGRRHRDTGALLSRLRGWIDAS